MKNWLLAALAFVYSGQPAHAQEDASVQSDPSAETATAVASITGDDLTASSTQAFLAALKELRDYVASERIDVPQDASNDVTNECASDEPPFADLLTQIPTERLEEIVQSHGFKDGAHWQRLGAKVLTKSSIEAMAKQAQLTDEEMRLVVGDAFEVE